MSESAYESICKFQDQVAAGAKRFTNFLFKNTDSALKVDTSFRDFEELSCNSDWSLVDPNTAGLNIIDPHVERCDILLLHEDKQEEEAQSQYNQKVFKSEYEAEYRDNLVELQVQGFCDFEQNLTALQNNKNNLEPTL